MEALPDNPVGLMCFFWFELVACSIPIFFLCLKDNPLKGNPLLASRVPMERSAYLLFTAYSQLVTWKKNQCKCSNSNQVPRALQLLTGFGHWLSLVFIQLDCTSKVDIFSAWRLVVWPSVHGIGDFSCLLGIFFLPSPLLLWAGRPHSWGADFVTVSNLCFMS